MSAPSPIITHDRAVAPPSAHNRIVGIAVNEHGTMFYALTSDGAVWLKSVAGWDLVVGYPHGGPL